MTEQTGVQVFVGPANQLEIGDVTTGPAAVTLETVTDRLQRLHLTIPSPTQDLVDEAAASATAAGNAVTAATAAQQAAANSAAAAAASQTAAEAARPSTAELEAMVLDLFTPGTVLIDTDGRPYIA